MYLKTTQNWTNTAKAIIARKIQIKSSRTTSEAIRLQPTTIADYRNLTKFLASKNMEYFTFRLPAENPLQVVIRGLPSSVNTDEVLNTVKSRNYPAIAAYRIRNTPLITIHLERNEAGREIFHLTDLLYVKVKVEGKRRAPGSVQCHRCQKYGHSASGCNMDWRCFRCGENHPTVAYEKKDKNRRLNVLTA